MHEQKDHVVAFIFLVPASFRNVLDIISSEQEKKTLLVFYSYSSKMAKFSLLYLINFLRTVNYTSTFQIFVLVDLLKVVHFGFYGQVALAAFTGDAQTSRSKNLVMYLIYGRIAISFYIFHERVAIKRGHYVLLFMVIVQLIQICIH